MQIFQENSRDEKSHLYLFYFLLIRPQQKKAKKHKLLLDSMKKGDNVITAGGIHGQVSAVENDLVMLDVANNVSIRITKSYIATIKMASFTT